MKIAKIVLGLILITVTTVAIVQLYEATQAFPGLIKWIHENPKQATAATLAIIFIILLSFSGPLFDNPDDIDSDPDKPDRAGGGNF